MKRFLLALAILFPSFAYAQATNYCVNQSYNTFEGGTVGAQPTSTTLNASQHGVSVGSWTLNGSTVMTYSSVDMPALVAPGRLCADSVTYPNAAGLTGIVFTGDGGHDFNDTIANLAGTVPTNMWATMEINEDFGDGDPSKIDAFGIHGTNDFILLNMYGTSNPGGHRFIQAECTAPGCSASPNVNWEPSTQCPCKVIIHYQAGNGSVAGTHQVFVLDKNGASIASFAYPSKAAIDLANRVFFGDVQNNNNVTLGKHVWFDNLQISYDNSIPGQFCAGASPTWTSSPDIATLQLCQNGITASDTINVLSGIGTWTTEFLNNSVPVKIIGATTVSGQGGGSPSAVDNTTIYLSHTAGNGTSLGLNIPTSGCPTPTSSTPCVRLSGFTFIDGTVGANGSIVINGSNAWPPPAGRFRIDNIHQIAQVSGPTGEMVHTQNAFGVIDHIYSQNHSASTIPHIAIYGDAANHGFGSWNTALALGTDQAVYVETSSFLDDFCNTEGPGDGYAGGRGVYRFIYGLNNHTGFHGTDSNNSLSFFSLEQYGNTWVNNACSGLTNVTLRGGTMMWFGDAFSGSDTWSGGKLQELRSDSSVATGNDWATWGYANGTPWFLNSATLGNGGTLQSTTSGADWQASHSYTCSQASPCVIIPTSNNASSYNFVSFSSCASSSSRPNPFNQAPGSSTLEGSCTWVNGWGVASSGANAQWCPLNKDVLVTNISQCPAGDQTGTLGFLDGPSSAFGYPGRNQIGRSNLGPGTGETLSPVYAWLNTGSNASLFVQNDPSGNFINANRDYYNYQTSGCTGTQTTGVCSGTLASRAANCTTGVGFWATNQGNWNHTGNGFGQGQFYQCVSTNTWASYYTPLTAPHPLIGGGGSGPAASPSFNPPAGTYTTPQSVVLSSAAATVICYNTTGAPQTNGSTGCTAGTLYSSAITVSAPETIFAVGGGTGFTDSPVTSAAYSFVPGLSPASFNFGSVQVGTMGAPQSFTLSNYTGSTITYQGATFAAGTNYGLNNPGTTCTGNLPTSNTCIISVIFSPTNTGSLPDTLQANFTGASGSPATSSLSGTGIAATVPALPTAKALIAKNLAACPACPVAVQPCLCFTLDQNIYLSTGGAWSLFASLVPPVQSVNGKKGAVTLTVQ